MKKLRKRCNNCRHAGNKFKIWDKTHLYCRHPSVQERMKEPDSSVYEALKVFWDDCNKWELETKTL